MTLNKPTRRPGRPPLLAPAPTLLGLLIASGGASPLQAQFEFGSEADDFAITLDPLIQGRYAIERGDEGTTTEFDFRRAWLDTTGTLFHPDLSFRLQPDFSSGELSMRDVWLQYALTESLDLRAGQFTVPFGLPRDIGGPNRLFTELSIAGNQFEVPAGRDTGVTLLGGDGDDRAWAIGVFDGRGRLDQRDDRPSTSGHLFSARGAWAPVGTLPRDNTTVGKPVEHTVAHGVGLQAANRNHLRDWTRGRENQVNQQRADWVTATADSVVKFARTAISVAAFRRDVSPDHGPSYHDLGAELELAQALPWEGLEVAARHAVLRHDAGDDLGTDERWQREWGAGLNWYHRGQRQKTQLMWLDRDAGTSDWELHLQHQFRF
ncbi:MULTISPECIES: porin [unclassified Thioalkalivibrio]|uniref:porin n=1 Tax=unclassified Thioalkalivibrio TaxID=2621013 RepID=UPI00056E32D3|nr:MULTISPECIES: porin [unclassified Thioalkalivibrio]